MGSFNDILRRLKIEIVSGEPLEDQALRVSAVAGRTLRHMRGPGMTHALICFDSGVTAVFEAILAPGSRFFGALKSLKRSCC